MLTKRTNQKPKTQAEYPAASSIRAAKSPMFSESSFQSRLDFLISSVPDSLRDGIEIILRGLVTENMSDIEKMKRAKVVVKLAQHPDVQELINNMLTNEESAQKELALIEKRVSELEEAIKEQADHDPSFLEHLAKILGTASLNYMVPGLGLAALGMPVAAAAGVPGVQWFAGQPVGGEDMCLGNTATCEQGFLAQTGKPDTWFSQYNRNVEVAVAGGNIDTSFANCLSVENVGNAVANFFNENSTRTNGTECIANSGVVRGTMSAIKATNIPLAGKDCSVFSKAMNGLYETCSYLPVDNTKTIIIASIAGAVGVAALVTLIACCCRKRRNKGYSNLG